MKQLKNMNMEAILFAIRSMVKGHTKTLPWQVTKANELCELDGGIELLRTSKESVPKSFSLHNEQLDFNIIYTDPKL